jgi:riboflavin synthase
MFTGIIEDLGVVRKVEKGKNYKLTVQSPIFRDQKIGDSIAVNGPCLTVSGLRDDMADFDVMPETIKKSNLGNLRVGERVNLERALKAGDRLGGHFVTGHIDCVGKILDKQTGLENYFLKVQILAEYTKYIVPQGSVSLDGASLTIAYIGKSDFSVCLIPHTIKNTDLWLKKNGDTLNIEFDILGKYVSNFGDFKKARPEITEDFLRSKGF